MAAEVPVCVRAVVRVVAAEVPVCVRAVAPAVATPRSAAAERHGAATSALHEMEALCARALTAE
jgi:hypothetical protein